MATLYADENIPQPLVLALRALGHGVLTAFEAGQANQRIDDGAVLEFASPANRALLSHNRRHFIRLHTASDRQHGGIVVCTVDADFAALAGCIHREITPFHSLKGQLVRVTRRA